jgi:branched-chain amino acid transport system permease protein
MLIGMGVAGIIAFIVGLPCLRLHGHYLAVATLGIGVIANIVMREWSEVTGGTSGIEGITKLSVLSNPIDSNTEYFYLSWTLAIVTLLCAGNIVNSRVGRALRALHTSESAAATLGVNIASYKLQVFVLSAIFAALAGSLYAHIVFFISPPLFGFMKSVEFVVMVVIGGMASIWGAVIGAGTMTMLGEWLRDLGTQTDKYGDKFAQFDIIAHGLILILVMIFLPNGIFCTLRDAVMRWWRGRRKAAKPLAAAESAKEVAAK